MAQPNLTTTCAKCGRTLKWDTGGNAPDLERLTFPAYCAKCELVNALLVERYTKHERAAEDG